MIRELEISRYRSVEKASFAFGPVRILIGANASGKSNLVDSLRLLSESVRDDVETAVTRRGGLDEVLFLGAPAGDRSFEISLDYFVPDPSAPGSRSDMKYRVQVGERRGRPGVALEELRIKRNRGERGRSNVWFTAKWGRGEALRDPETPVRERFDTGDPGVLALKALGFLDAYPRIRALRRFVEGWRFLAVDLARVREPQRDRRETELAPDAGNLANVLRTLDAADRPCCEQILEDVHSLLAHVERISTEVDRGRVILLMKERGMPRPLEALSLSDGTLRILAMVTALQTMPEHGLLCVEEPEHGLHPLLFGPLLDLIRERCPAVGSRQTLLTTHSPDLIDAAEPEEVIPIERAPSGSTQLRPLDAPQLARWMEDFRLGELWRMRQIGGVP